jgi:hypothetical protein
MMQSNGFLGHMLRKLKSFSFSSLSAKKFSAHSWHSIRRYCAPLRPRKFHTRERSHARKGTFTSDGEAYFALAMGWRL